MISKVAMSYLARNPRAMIEYQVTGREPRGGRPDSPHFRLIESISPRARIVIEGVRIDQLGYCTHHEFRNAEQLYRGLKPSGEVFGSYPAQIALNRRFARLLSIDDLLKFSRSHPDWVTKERMP